MWVHSYTRPLWYIWNEWQFNITKTLFAESIRTFIDRREGRFLFFWCYVMCLTVMWCDYWDVGEEEIVSGHFLCSGFRRCLVSVNDDGISPRTTGNWLVYCGWWLIDVYLSKRCILTHRKLWHIPNLARIRVSMYSIHCILSRKWKVIK